MNCTDQVLREELLSALDKNRTSYGVNVTYLSMRLREKAITAAPGEIVQHLDYLASRPAKPLVEEASPEINRHNRVWKITADGIRYVDEHNL